MTAEIHEGQGGPVLGRQGTIGNALPGGGVAGSQCESIAIQRGPALAFYNSERSEQKGSGQDRRSIANHDELYRLLCVDDAHCLNVMPETLRLARQIALFSLADIIIAQHGAALANIVWARPNATVIEILPDTLAPVLKDQDLFRNLSRCLGLRYRRIRQDDEHSDVDIDKIRKVVARSVASPGCRAISGIRAVAFRTCRPALPIVRKLRSFAGRGHDGWDQA